MTDLFWIIFEYGINLLQGLFCSVLAVSCLDLKDNVKIKRKFIPLLISSLLVFTAITLCNLFTFFEGLGALLNSAGVFLVSMLFLKGTPMKKVFFAILPVNAQTVGSIISTNVMAYILNRPFYEFIMERSFLRILTVLISNLIFISIVLVVMFITKKTVLKLKETEWFLLSINLVLAIIAYMFIFNAILSGNSILVNFYLTLCAIVIVTINIVIYYLLAKYSNRSLIEAENQQLKQHTDYQNTIIEETKRQHDTLRKMKHEFNNNIGVINSLLNENKISEAREFINEYYRHEKKTKVLVQTGNSFIDAILNTKITEASRYDIEVSVSTISLGDFPDSMRLCSLLGNLLDNAIRASEQSSEKLIKIDISKDGSCLTVNVKNSIDSSVLDVNPHLKSDKADTSSHGYGIKIIRDIARSFDGFVDFYEEMGFFCCNVILYL